MTAAEAPIVPVAQPDSSLLAIKYARGNLEILDQLLLPHTSVYIPVNDVQTGWTAIKTMQVRGAPAIAIVAALSLAVELYNAYEMDFDLANGATNGHHSKGKISATEAVALIDQQLDFLCTSRPTAVNLADASKKLKTITQNALTTENITGETVLKIYIEAAEYMLLKDVDDNKAIGRLGALWIANSSGRTDGLNVLTHCNTGSLATASYGTALGIIRSLHSNQSLGHAYCTETRPYNQGSRLTAYELVHDNIPATLITDSMAASLMSQQSISAIVVGADRVAANGDTANKIGTFQLAVLARYFGVKFVVAAPTTSVDLNTPSGKEIVVEQRPGWEVLIASGPTVKSTLKNGSVALDMDVYDIRTVKTAANGIGVFNPSFDVTPAHLIDAIVTETGVVEKEPGALEFVMQKAFGLA